LEKEKLVCDVCDQEFKTPNALGAHRRLKHGIEVEKIEPSALLEILRSIESGIGGLKAGIEKVKSSKKEVSNVEDTAIKEGFEATAQNALDSLSVALKRVDSLEKKLGEAEDANAEAVLSGFGKVLERVDNVERRFAGALIPEKLEQLKEEELKKELEKLIPVMRKFDFNIVHGGPKKDPRYTVEKGQFFH